MIEHSHIWNTEVVDDFYDEDEEEGGKVKEPLRSLLRMDVHPGCAIMQCKECAACGVWIGADVYDMRAVDLVKELPAFILDKTELDQAAAASSVS